MPYYTKEPKADLDKYVNSLVKELNGAPAPYNAASLTPQTAPTIIEEPGQFDRIGVTVLWDEWTELSGEERGRVIMKAYEIAKGADFIRKIGLALGLTHSQKNLILD